jgi:ABC-type sugar transport system ATPase subunit
MFLAETVREELVAGAAELSKEPGGEQSKLGEELLKPGFGLPKSGKRKIEEVAERFGLSHRLQAHPFRLSEGEKRRLNLAVAFAVRRPCTYWMNPPTGWTTMRKPSSGKTFDPSQRRGRQFCW